MCVSYIWDRIKQALAFALITPVQVQWAFFLTEGEENSGKLDNEIFARAAKLAPVNIPPSVGGSVATTPELVQVYLTSQSGPFAVIPGQGHNIWHMITNWGHSGFYYNVLDKRTGEVERAYIGDTVEVQFEDGSTWQLEFIGPIGPAGSMFLKVSGSERDANGEPLAGPTGSPSTPGAELDFVFASLLELEAAPMLDCAIQVKTRVCDVYGLGQCFEHVREVNVPCQW